MSEATQLRASPLYTVPPGHLLLHLSSGKTAAFSLPSNPAASFYLYIPSLHPVSRRTRGEDIISGSSRTTYPLVVCVHGSARDAQGVRDRWADMAEREGFVVLCPLFPVDMQAVDGMHNYKLLRYPLKYGESSTSSSSPSARTTTGMYTRYDQLLLEMVDLVHDRWGYVETEKFGLTGYSGGAQFAHRFFYLHPSRVAFISAGAPGTATPLSSSSAWPGGISDILTVFDGAEIDISTLRRTPTHLIVGLEDKWRPVANDGSTPKMNRIETMRMLRDDWRSNGLEVEYEEIEGVGHEEVDVLEQVQAFVVGQLRRLRSDTTPVRLDGALPKSRIKEIVHTLFGHSEVLDQHLLPAISASLSQRPLNSYQSLIDLCETLVDSWDYKKKGQFLAGHPEIGAPKVTGLSAMEQGTSQVNPITLNRLQQLNGEYRKRYPGLIYLTFVNGRSREAIADELEAFLDKSTPGIKQPSSQEWKLECDRGVQAVIEISRDRLKKLGWGESSQ